MGLNNKGCQNVPYFIESKAYYLTSGLFLTALGSNENYTAFHYDTHLIRYFSILTDNKTRAEKQRLGISCLLT